MSEEAAEYKVQVKREPVAVRLSQDIIVLGRSLARSKYGSEDKLGNLIEEAIKFLSANSEDEARATALLSITEERLLRRITDKFESMNKDLAKRENKMVERVAGLQAVSAFETCLVELLLKDRLLKTDRDKARYEELRSTAATKMKDRLVKAGAEQIAELQEQNQNLQNELENYQAECKDEIRKYQRALQQANANIENLKSMTLNKDNEIARLKDTIGEYDRLVTWYERREKETPMIQEQNKTLGVKQNYEKAMGIFEQQNPKPQKPSRF